MESKSHPELVMAMVMDTDMVMAMATATVMAAGIIPMIPHPKKCKSFSPVSGENNAHKLFFLFIYACE